MDPLSKEAFELQRKLDGEEINIRGKTFYNDWGELPLAICAYYILSSSGQRSDADLYSTAAMYGTKLGYGQTEELEILFGSDILDIARHAGEVYKSKMAETPELFDGTESMLDYLHSNAYMILLSEYFESAEAQMKKITHYHLAKYFDEIRLVERKPEEEFIKAKESGRRKITESGVSEFKVLQLDDRVKYVEIGNRLGMTTFWTPIGLNGRDIFGEVPETDTQMPKYVADDMEKLLASLKNELE